MCVCVWLLTLFNVIWHQIHRSISLHIFQMLDMFVTDKEYYNWHFGNIHNRNLLVCSRALTDIFACVAVRQQLLKPRTPIKYIRKNQRLASDNENPIRIHANVQSERILHFKCETLPPHNTRLDFIHAIILVHSVIFMAISHLINSRWKKLHFVIELKKMNFEHVHRLHFFFAFSKAIDYQELSFPLRKSVNADWNRAKETIYLNEHQMTYLEWLWVRFCFFLDASYYCAFERSVTFILAESQKFILFPSEELLHFTRFILISTRFSNFV